MTIRSLLLKILAVAALLMACNDPICGCTPARTQGLIFGTVTTSAGAPAIGATVRAQPFQPNCPDAGPASPLGEDMTISDSAGKFRMRVYSISRPGPACVRVSAFVAGTTDTTVLNLSLLMRAEGSAPDSARADLVLK